MSSGIYTIQGKVPFIPLEDAQTLLKKAGLTEKILSNYTVELHTEHLQIQIKGTRYGMRVQNLYRNGREMQPYAGKVITNPIADWKIQPVFDGWVSILPILQRWLKWMEEIQDKMESELLGEYQIHVGNQPLLLMDQINNKLVPNYPKGFSEKLSILTFIAAARRSKY